MDKLTPIQRVKGLLSLEKKAITQVYIYAFFNGLVNLTLPLGIQVKNMRSSVQNRLNQLTIY